MPRVLPESDDGTIHHNYIGRYRYRGRRLPHEYLFLKYLQKEILKNSNLAMLIYIYIYCNIIQTIHG